MLNKADVSDNKNRFYLMQLLEKGGKYAVWMRWGRIGVSGQTKMEDYGTDLSKAVKKFEEHFKSKTGVAWEVLRDRNDFETKDGKYFVIERDYENDVDLHEKKKAKLSGENGSKSKLQPEVVELLELITDEDMMIDQMT